MDNQDEFTKGQTFIPTEHVDREMLFSVQRHIHMAALGSIAIMALEEIDERAAHNIVVSELIHTAFGMFFNFEENGGREPDPDKFVALVKQSVDLIMAQRQAAEEALSATKQ